jgi:uncharacterized membrane protein
MLKHLPLNILFLGVLFILLSVARFVSSTESMNALRAFFAVGPATALAAFTLLLPYFLMLLFKTIFIFSLIVASNAASFSLGRFIKKREQKILPLFISPALLFAFSLFSEGAFAKTLLVWTVASLIANAITASRYYKTNPAPKVGDAV